MLRVVAAVVLQDQRLLVVSKQAAPTVFYLPGGKPDADETESQTLYRELTEEVGARPVDARPYLVIEALSALEKVPMRLAIYRCSLSGPPSRAGEIARLGWTNGADEYAAGLAPAIGGVLVPKLRQDGLIAA
jgi:8-oxo-dGTP diphosphatase